MSNETVTLPRAVVEQSIIALEGCYGRASSDGVRRVRAINALREALSQQTAGVPDDQMQGMVNRFLSWRLPQDFYPDAFISFDREKHDTWGGYPNSWPTGTNLLHAEQARAMLEHVIGTVPAQVAGEPVAWMTDDGRGAHDTTKQCMPNASRVSFCIPLYAAPQPTMPVERDAIAVNLMRHCGLDKHKARECADIVQQVYAEHRGLK